MPGDLELLPAAAAGPAVMAAELLSRIRAELPAIGGLEEREQVLVAAWLTGLRSARTRRAYAGDVTAWLGWLADVLAAGRVHVDLWAATWLDGGAAALSVPLWKLRNFIVGRVHPAVLGRVTGDAQWRGGGWLVRRGFRQRRASGPFHVRTGIM